MADQKPSPGAAVGGVQGSMRPQPLILPNHYFNGFVNGLGNSDISSILLLDGQPVAKISMSFTTAKTFVKLLAELVNDLERVTNHEIMTTEDVERGLRELTASEGKRNAT